MTFHIKVAGGTNNRFGGECHDDNGLYVLKINMNIECNLILLMSLGSPIQNKPCRRTWKRGQTSSPATVTSTGNKTTTRSREAPSHLYSDFYVHNIIIKNIIYLRYNSTKEHTHTERPNRNEGDKKMYSHVIKTMSNCACSAM